MKHIINFFALTNHPLKSWPHARLWSIRCNWVSTAWM